MKRLFKLLFKLFTFGFACATAMGLGFALYAISLLPNLPTVDEIRQIPLNVPLRIYTSDRQLIAEYGNERRIPLTLDETPPLLIDAILSVEDDQFYHHTGVDFPGIIRAVIVNLRSQASSQGASTITMQVARNFFLSPEQTYIRKLREILLSFNIERALTKDEILELYLNKIFLGHRSYGFAAASQVYYGEDLLNLSVPEIAMLAGLPKAPSRDNPISNPSRASKRRGHVLDRLFELGKIDKLSVDTARKAPVTAYSHSAEVDLQAPYVAEMARQQLYDEYGDAIYAQGLNVILTVHSKYQKQATIALRKGILDYDLRHGYRGPVKNIDITDLEELDIDVLLDDFPSSQELKPAVVTSAVKNKFMARTGDGETVSVALENMLWARAYKTPNSQGPEPTDASNVVKTGDVVYLIQEDNHWRLSQLPDVSGALVSLDSNTGAILALSGGFDYYLSKFNRATQAERQPGSNIKPFIYSAALDNGFTPGSLVSGAPIVVEDNLEGVWRPENYSKKFFGPTRLRKALSLSLNLVSVRLLRTVGFDTTIDHLSKFGFDPQKLPRSLSLSLGSTAVTPLELAKGYTVIANGGKSTAPYLIDHIENNEGVTLESPLQLTENCATCGSIDTTEIIVESDETEIINAGGRVISEQNTFLTTSIMKQVILSGTGRRALALGRNDLAGKTGTTNNFRDAWFSGFNPDVTTTVFVGFDEPAHLGRRESGASAALPIWVDYMGTVLKDFPERPAVIPDQIITRFINKESGKLTALDDPDGYHEYFLTGTEPQNNIQPVAKNTDQPTDKQAEEATTDLF